MSDPQKEAVVLPKFEIPTTSAEIKNAPELTTDAARTEAHIDEQIESLPAVAATIPTATTPTAIAAPKDPLTKELETILEDGIADMYATMQPEQQLQFKLEGERVTSTLRQMVKSGIVHIKRVLSLILEWLKMIPGVNKFFIEKEAKIKAERVLHLRTQF